LPGQSYDGGSCISCDVGKFSSIGLTCDSCQLGFYAEARGAVNCIPCAPGMSHSLSNMYALDLDLLYLCISHTPLCPLLLTSPPPFHFLILSLIWCSFIYKASIQTLQHVLSVMRESSLLVVWLVICALLVRALLAISLVVYVLMHLILYPPFLVYEGKYSANNGSVECSVCDAGKLNVCNSPLPSINLIYVHHYALCCIRSHVASVCTNILMFVQTYTRMRIHL